MQDWEVTLKESILSVYSSFDIQKHREDKAIDLLIKALSIVRKKNQRQGQKQVFLSKEIQNNPLYKDFENEINEIKLNFENGFSEQNYQRLSKEHHLNFTYRDTMLDVLNIEHFHLGKNREETYRSSELLFVKYYENSVYFIDIFKHNNFLDDSILLVLHNNWENIIATFKYPSKIQLSTSIENKNRYLLYKKNVNSVYEIIDRYGQKYCYGTHGVMSNGEAMQDVHYAIFFQREIEYFQNNIDYFASLVYQNLLQIFQNSFAELNFLVVWLADFGVCFMEANSNTYFVLNENEIVFVKHQPDRLIPYMAREHRITKEEHRG